MVMVAPFGNYIFNYRAPIYMVTLEMITIGHNPLIYSAPPVICIGLTAFHFYMCYGQLLFTEWMSDVQSHGGASWFRLLIQYLFQEEKNCLNM